jgi:hypothetical protein
MGDSPIEFHIRPLLRRSSQNSLRLAEKLHSIVGLKVARREQESSLIGVHLQRG